MKVSNGLCHSARNGVKIYERHRLAEVADESKCSHGVVDGRENTISTPKKPKSNLLII